MNSVQAAQPNIVTRRFFVILASAIIVAVFAGFAPTFYLRGHFTQDRPMSVLLHVHGIVFSAWVILFLVQAVLISRGARRLHQRLGWVTVAVAAAMVCLVVAAVIEQLRRVHGFPPPPLAVSLSAFDIVVFATLVATAVGYRRRADWHKRLLLSATILLLGAPMFRVVVHYLDLSDMGKVGLLSTLLADAFFLPCLVYDLATRRAIHPAYWFAFALIGADQIAQATVVSWAPWVEFTYALQRWVS